MNKIEKSFDKLIQWCDASPSSLVTFSRTLIVMAPLFGIGFVAVILVVNLFYNHQEYGVPLLGLGLLYFAFLHDYLVMKINIPPEDNTDETP